MGAIRQQCSSLASAGSTPNEAQASIKGATFFDLPREVRDKIYRLVLTHDAPFAISRNNKSRIGTSSTSEQAPRGRWCPPTGHKHKLSCKTSTALGKSRRKATVSEAVSLSLLSTSKQVNDEAASVFFGENCFVFGPAVALEAFCATLGEKTRLLSRIGVKESTTELARDSICLLSRLVKLVYVSVAAQHRNRDVRDWLCPKETWDFVKPVVWRSGQVLRPGMSFRPVDPLEVQLRRIEAFRFDVSACETIMVDNRKTETIKQAAEREDRLKELVIECWRKDLEFSPTKRQGPAQMGMGDFFSTKKRRLL